MLAFYLDSFNLVMTGMSRIPLWRGPFENWAFFFLVAQLFFFCALGNHGCILCKGII
jgi:hypothetical protein